MHRYRGALRCLTAGVTVGIAAALGMLVFGLVGTRVGAGPGPASAATTPAVASVAPALKANYSIFAGSSSPGPTTMADLSQGALTDGFSGVASVLAAGDDEEVSARSGNGALTSTALGLDYAATREVTASGTSVWVVPGSNGMCAMVPTPDNGVDEICGTLVGIAKSGGVLSGIVRDPSSGAVTAFGVAPDSVGATTEIRGQSIPVEDNVLVGALPASDFPAPPPGATFRN